MVTQGFGSSAAVGSKQLANWHWQACWHAKKPPKILQLQKSSRFTIILEFQIAPSWGELWCQQAISQEHKQEKSQNVFVQMRNIFVIITKCICHNHRFEGSLGVNKQLARGLPTASKWPRGHAGEEQYYLALPSYYLAVKLVQEQDL